MEINEVALDTLTPFPANPRKGNIDIIIESLQAYGQYKPITVNKRNNQILVGNHTYQAAQKLGWKTINITYIDVEEDTAAKIVLMDNRSADAGSYDHTALLELLETAQTLDNTGYTEETVDSILARIEEESTKSFADEPNVFDGFADRYMSKNTKMLLMEIENNRYVWVIDKLSRYRATYNLTSNAEAIVKLVEEATQQKAPR